jgi:quinol monooxygenase YgiN
VFCYNLKLVVMENKIDEFIDALRFLSSDVHQEEGCFDFSLYRDLHKKDVYNVHGEWKTRTVMENHFKNNSFSVLIGATKALGKDFEMSIGETIEQGSYPLAKEKIELQLQGSGMVDKGA